MANKVKSNHSRVEYLVGYILGGERPAGSACFQSEVCLDFGRSIVKIRADYRLSYSGPAEALWLVLFLTRLLTSKKCEAVLWEMDWGQHREGGRCGAPQPLLIRT
jgi:hypothetical protein